MGRAVPPVLGAAQAGFVVALFPRRAGREELRPARSPQPLALRQPCPVTSRARVRLPVAPRIGALDRVVAVCPLFPAAVRALGIVVVVGLVFVVAVVRLDAHASTHSG